ncbi:MAG: hypothetical protein C4530_00660 [Desulfobacteraceae bacterium]|jgi:hypothetical protein|nr:MAG: hypothetical protein C4530_00660 [Desulfobacteraceae bacterium]
MKCEVIRVSKGYRPLKREEVLELLKKEFPEFEYIACGETGNALVVKRSSFSGAELDVAEKEIRLRNRVPRPFARALDLALMGTISAATAPKVTHRIKKFLKERYSS